MKTRVWWPLSALSVHSRSDERPAQKAASPQIKTKSWTCNYRVLSVLCVFSSNGKKKASLKGNLISLLWSQNTQAPSPFITDSLHSSFHIPRTSLHLPLSQFTFPPFVRDASTPPNTIRRAIIHLRRAVPPLNGIIIGPALLLIAKTTIARVCARLNACASLAASDTSVARRMSMDRCARWSRTAGERGDLDLNEMVTKLALAN